MPTAAWTAAAAPPGWPASTAEMELPATGLAVEMPGDTAAPPMSSMSVANLASDETELGDGVLVLAGGAVLALKAACPAPVS